MAAETLAAIIRECDELFMWPTLDAQVAACVFAEKEARDLRLRGIDPQTGKYLQEPVPSAATRPWRPTLKQAALTASELKRQLMRDITYAENERRKTAAAVQACEEMQAKRDAETQRILAQQRENEQAWSTGVAWDDPRLNETTSSVSMPVACTEAIVNGHSTYLYQVPQHQQDVEVPVSRRSKRSPVAEYSTAGLHQKVGWNFYTDLFECHECDQGAQLKMDLMKLPCTRKKKGRR